MKKSPPTAAPEEENDRKFVVALARGLEVLRAFRPTDGFLGNQEIAERTGLARPTVTRLTYTLCQLGYLAKVPRIGKYRLAPTAITLGYSALAGFGIRRLARPFMDRVVAQTAAPVALAVVDRDAALYVDLSRGTAAFTIQLEIGSRLPIATTAIGRALFAASPPEHQRQLLDMLAGMHGDEWPTIRAGLDESLKEFAARRYITSTASWRSDVHAVAVPLVARDGSGIYAFNCGGPPHQFTPEYIHATVGPALLQMVGSIEDVLDGSLV
ncbi:MAG: IclR family transcriptional regulator [Mesorhizobium sp.]|nr:IclR family transcriptional regulator [Mesorhizobium sp.]